VAGEDEDAPALGQGVPEMPRAMDRDVALEILLAAKPVEEQHLNGADTEVAEDPGQGLLDGFFGHLGESQPEIFPGGLAAFLH
jgi:hypothetical protein